MSFVGVVLEERKRKEKEENRKEKITHSRLSEKTTKTSPYSTSSPGLKKRGHTLVSGGTDNHIVLADLRPKGVDGSRVERVLELAHIAANKNTVPGDVSAMVPGGLRMGSPALTSRGFTEGDFDKVAALVDRAVTITQDIKASGKAGTKLKEFKEYVDTTPPAAIAELAAEVETFAKAFPTIGFEKADMRYQD